MVFFFFKKQKIVFHTKTCIYQYDKYFLKAVPLVIYFALPSLGFPKQPMKIVIA